MSERERRPSRRKFSLYASAVALSCGGGGAGTSGLSDGGGGDVYRRGRPPHYETLDFFGLLNLGFHADYVPISSFADLARRSDLVAIGKMVAINEGRTIGGPRDSFDASFATSVANVDVERIVKGEPRPRLFFEFRHSPVVETPDLMKRLPNDRLLLFLYDTAPYPPKNLFDAGKGLPPGEILSGMVTLLGLVLERDGGLAFPVEPDRALWIERSLTTIDQAAEASKT